MKNCPIIDKIVEKCIENIVKIAEKCIENIVKFQIPCKI
jgi:hypothetical protein